MPHLVLRKYWEERTRYVTSIKSAIVDILQRIEPTFYLKSTTSSKIKRIKMATEVKSFKDIKKFYVILLQIGSVTPTGFCQLFMDARSGSWFLTHFVLTRQNEFLKLEF